MIKESEDDGELVDGVTENVLHHCAGNQGFLPENSLLLLEDRMNTQRISLPSIWFPVEQLISGGFSR